MLYLINKLLSIVSSDFYFFLLKKTQLVAYNAEITTAEITVIDLDLYGEHMPEKELQGQKPTSTYLPGRLIREYIRYASK